ncbi:hypothetical protein [Hyalangium sp.]|uniref:hypothetical protein n=1 Tax=Hyalangium sp. TaxID=2028555 RepID=UPI002D421B51|nr:hypothetical protein [Hyalangium sp.]HYI00041.1 hypothetical protein [Hyalangium sp.]
MKNTLRTISTCACALAIATTLASCMKTMPPGNTPPSFPGGDSITPDELNGVAVLPAPPPAYDGSITREQYARFAWRQFFYLNTPAKLSANYDLGNGFLPVLRGTASDDKGYNFLTAGSPTFFADGTHDGNSLGTRHLLWETFAHRSELFPANAPPTGELKALYPQYNFANVTFTNNNKNLIRFNNLDETTQIGQNQIFFPKSGGTPSANPYDDHLILFEAKVNGAEYDYVKNTIASVQNLKAGTYPLIADVHQAIPHIEFPPNTGNPDLPAAAQSDDESIEVKAAWREMTPELISSGRYHTAEATYYVKGVNGPEPQVGTFGLVGLHILRKMKNYPAFVYTTFEQVDSLQGKDGPSACNVNPLGTKGCSGLYVVTLYDKMGYRPTIANPQAMVNTGTGQFQSVPLPLEGQVDAAHGYPIIPSSEVQAPYAGPIPVQPSLAVTDAVTKVNAEVNQAIAEALAQSSRGQSNPNVWLYYRLAGIQILPVNENSTSPNTGAPDPLTEDFYLANTVIESSRPGIQLFKGAVSDPGVRHAAPDQLLNERSRPNILNVRGLPNDNTVVMGGCMGCHGNAQYPRALVPREPGGELGYQGTGPTIFNFLTNEGTLSGAGFEVDVRPTGVGPQRASTRVYIP